MKICFIGLGSIGSRHIKNLSKIFKERKIKYSIDALRSNENSLPEDVLVLINTQFYDIAQLPEDYDIIIIANPTSLHYGTIRDIAHKTKHMFIEKPVFDVCSYNLEELTINSKGIYYIACPLRFSPIIKFLKELVKRKKIYSVRAISSSYLPEWRKGIDYRNVYSAKKSQGGGVSLDLIHEWDYLIYLFGFPEQISNFKGTFSDLEIDSDDISVYIAKYRDKLVEVHLDYFGRSTTRQLELYCDDCVINADFNSMQINYKGTIQKEICLEKEDIYLNEMNYFIDMIINNSENMNDIHHAYKVLNLVVGDTSL